MTRRVPLLPTLIVAAAVATMIALGVWQLQRAEWKADLLARYSQAQAMSAEVPWSGDPQETESLLYRRARLVCVDTLADHPVAGRNTRGEAGWAQPHLCVTRQGFGVAVAIGWTKTPYIREISETTADDRLLTVWQGGEVTGVIGPGPRLVADPPLAGLQPLALPDPGDLPNNHLMYAGQWFFFALTALVIYVFALRKRWRLP